MALADWKRQQEELKSIFGNEYNDYNLVVCLPNGRPLEGQIITRRFNRFIEQHNLPKVVFHSLRHTSTTYKLKLNNGDVKSVQGDTGHSQAKMVSDVYSHIIDEDRKNNAERLDVFYNKRVIGDKSETQSEPKKVKQDTTKILELLNNNPALATQLLEILSAATA